MNAVCSKPLPNSSEAEEALLGCCLLDGTATVAKCIGAGVTPEAFFQPANRTIFAKLIDLHERKQSADAAVLAEELRGAGQLDTAGGIQYLAQLGGRVPTTAQADFFIRRVSDCHRRREVISSVRGLNEGAQDETRPLDEILATAAERLRKLETGAKGAPPFTVWTPAQFAAYTPSPDDCLLGDGFIERGEWTSLVGVGGLGKTRLALNLAIAQMTGKAWCGIDTHGEPQKTIFLSSENGVRRWKGDLERIGGTFTGAETDTVEMNLRILALMPDDDGDLCLGNPETFTRLGVTLSTEKPGIVVFDPFADMIEGDENKAVDVIATLRALRSLTRKACPTAAILIIHHARTGASNVAQAGDNFSAGNFGRGSKALYSRVRCELQLAPRDRDNPNRLVLACGKSNNSVKFAPKGIDFDPVTFTYYVDDSFDVDAWRNDVSGQRKDSAVCVADVVEIVKEKCPVPGDETTTSDVFEVLKDSGSKMRTVQRVLGEAVHQGYLRKGKKRGKWKLGAKPLP